MAPGAGLRRRQLQRGERERRRVHAQLGEDEHVERVGAYRRRDRRRRQRGAFEAAEVVDARGQRGGERIHADAQVIDEHLETGAVDALYPAPEVHADGAVAEERRREADAKPAATGGRARRRDAPLRSDRIDRRGDGGGVARLQLAIVLALVGEQEVGPAQVVDDVGEAAPAGKLRQQCREPREPGGVAPALVGDVLRALVDHRQRKRLADRGAQRRRPPGARRAVRAARAGEVVALGEATRPLQQRHRVPGVELRGARVDRRGLVDVATRSQHRCEARQRRSLVGLRHQRAPERVLRGGVVALLARDRREIGPGQRVVRIHCHGTLERGLCLAAAPAVSQRVAEVVPRPGIVGVEFDGAPERGDGVAAVAQVGKRDAQRVVRLRIGGLERDGAAQVGDGGGGVAHSLVRLGAQQQGHAAVGDDRCRRGQQRIEQHARRVVASLRDVAVGLGKARVRHPPLPSSGGARSTDSAARASMSAAVNPLSVSAPGADTASAAR